MTEQALWDINIMMRACGIIQVEASGWSSFSNLASFIREVPLLNVGPGGLQRFRKYGELPHYLYPSDNVSEFVKAGVERCQGRG